MPNQITLANLANEIPQDIHAPGKTVRTALKPEAVQPSGARLSASLIEREWSFADKTIKDTAYITHGYYTYPAKFIPQLAARLIDEYSSPGELVIDPFMGSGTTVVESLVHRRVAMGVDVNEIAVLLSKVKATPINDSQLGEVVADLLVQLQNESAQQRIFNKKRAIKKTRANDTKMSERSERLDYWFKPQAKTRLAFILEIILCIEPRDVRDFLLVAFAQILKSCSVWMQKSVKPMRDMHKKEIDPLMKFEWQVKRMLKKHMQFNALLDDDIKQNIKKFLTVKNSDARALPCTDGSASLIVTSPPYVTSYEYADLHQLSSCWFGHLKELSEFRKKFIGSSARQRDTIALQSTIADEIVGNLGKNKVALGVQNYFADMLESFREMHRALKVGGIAAVVIGNTTLRGVNILNAEVFQQQFENNGFKVRRIVHREIPSKMLPSTRDPKTGKFTKANANSKYLAYPTEYILIMEKKHRRVWI